MKDIKAALNGELDFGPEATTLEKRLDCVFGVTESVVETPDIDSHTGDVRGTTRRVVGRSIDPQAKHDFDSIGPEAVGRELMGRSFYQMAERALANLNFWPTIQALRGSRVRVAGVTEEVAPETASMYEPINTWGSFTLGLYDHKILQAYESAPRIFTKVMPTVPALIHGSQKHTLHDYDGTLPSFDGLNEGVEADTVKGAPMWVWSQAVKEFQLQFALTMEAMMSDLDGGLQRRGEQIGEALAKLENYRALQHLFGYVNTYCINANSSASPSCNTVLSGANVGGYSSNPPLNYVNLFYSDPLLSVETLNNAYIKMLQLQAPVTNWRMDLGNKFQLLVSPTIAMLAGQIVKQIMNYRGNIAASTGAVGSLSQSENPLVIADLDIEVISIGIEGKDVLTGGLNSGNSAAATMAPQTWSDYQYAKANSSNLNPLTQHADAPGVLMSTNNTPPTAANSGSNSADGFWMLVSKKHTFIQYEPWIPIRPNVYPLTGTDLARRIGMRGDGMVASRFVTLEPRAAQVHLPNASGTL
jgi:hypothetical protein